MDLPNDQLPLIIQALEHYAAYLRATNRDDRYFAQLAEQLKRKQPEGEAVRPQKKKRA